MLDLAVSVMGEYPKEKVERTHFRRTFKTKRDQWDWIKRNMPDAVELIYAIKERFGEIKSVEIDSPIRGGACSP